MIVPKAQSPCHCRRQPDFLWLSVEQNIFTTTVGKRTRLPPLSLRQVPDRSEFSASLPPSRLPGAPRCIPQRPEPPGPARRKAAVARRRRLLSSHAESSQKRQSDPAP